MHTYIHTVAGVAGGTGGAAGAAGGTGGSHRPYPTLNEQSKNPSRHSLVRE